MKPLSVAALVLAAAALARAADERPVLRYVPKHEELKYTFGGAAPTHRIKPGTRIVSWSEDCFDGALDEGRAECRRRSCSPATTTRRRARSTSKAPSPATRSSSASRSSSRRARTGSPSRFRASAR